MDNRAFRVPESTKFMVILVQEGEGCDYTIGCGVRVVPLRAATVEDARVEAERMIHRDGYLDREGSVEKAVLVTAHEYLPVVTWKANKLLVEKSRVESQERQRELAELERLKKKYEG
jgi:hypothetical protein